jgi:hypothetical protein
MTDRQPLSASVKMLMALCGSGFLVLVGGFCFILWKITR